MSAGRIFPKVLLVATVMGAISILSGCKKEEANVSTVSPDAEFITTVKLVAVNQTDTSIRDTAYWQQLAVGLTPDTTNAVLNLQHNTPYTLYAYFLDESKNPATDITEEIRDRQNYHLVCYEATDSLQMGIEAVDRDNNTPQLPVGLINNVTVPNTGTGRLHVTLHHQPNIKNGDCSRGSTDVDVYFNVIIH